MLKKDILTLCLLHLLTHADRYGYEMLSILHNAFPDTQESVIYALLRGLCKEGCTEHYQGKISAGPVRKYYRLTPAGHKKYETLLLQWRALLKSMKLLGVK